MKNGTIVIGTRSSKLALWQADYVAERLKERYPDLRVEKKLMTTKGDKILDAPLAKIGGAVGLSSDATAGLLAGSANVLALFSMVKDLRAKDKVICMAFAVCCAFLFGDHLSFTANFQPNLIVVVLAGKLVAGICAIVFAKLLAVKKAEQLEREAGEDVLYDAEHAVESVE